MSTRDFCDCHHGHLAKEREHLRETETGVWAAEHVLKAFVGVSRNEETQELIFENALGEIETVMDMKGDKGDTGDIGDKGDKGDTGDKGNKGDTGKSAFEYAVSGGYAGTEKEFKENVALMGDTGEKLDSFSEQLAHTEEILSRRNIVPAGTRYVGHRGASGYAPENTLAAIQKAAELGYWGSECDPKLTKDKEIVIMHDNTLDRTSDGIGYVSDYTLAEIKEFNIVAGSYLDSYPTQKVPTFEEQIATCKKYNIVCVAHGTLPGYSDKMLEIIRRYDMEDNTVFLTDLAFCKELRGKSSKLTLFYITFNALNKKDIDIAKENGVGLSYASSSTPTITSEYLENVQYAHSRGVVLNAWVENDGTRFQMLKEHNVQYITTDSLTLDNLSTTIGEKQLQHTRHTYTKSEYVNSMSAALKVEHENIPASNGYHYDVSKNIFYVNSPSGKQGFAYYKGIGAVKKGDVIEVFVDVNVKSGTFRTCYDLPGRNGLETEVLGVGTHKIYRKFIVPTNSLTCSIVVGANSSEASEYEIIDGITINISSNVNYKKPSLGTVLVTSASLEERFSVYNSLGDECTITKTSDYYIQVTFSESLVRRGIPVVTIDAGGDKYQARTSSATEKSVAIKFLDNTFTQVALSSLPNYMYVNVALI